MISSRITKVTSGVVKRFIQTLTSTLDPVQEKAMRERCILINDNDEAIGDASKRDCHLIKNNCDILLHRAFSVFLFNSKDELLLQKRSSTKITYPDHVSNTCCSHPLYDIECERSVENANGVKLAAQRRLNIELGIPLEEVCTSMMHYITRIHYKSLGDGVWGEHEIDYILFMKKDFSLNPNPDEVSDLYFVPKDNLTKYLASLQCPVTPWFKHLVQSNLMTYWWDNLHKLDKITDTNKIHRLSTI